MNGKKSVDLQKKEVPTHDWKLLKSELNYIAWACLYESMQEQSRLKDGYRSSIHLVGLKLLLLLPYFQLWYRKIVVSCVMASQQNFSEKVWSLLQKSLPPCQLWTLGNDKLTQYLNKITFLLEASDSFSVPIKIKWHFIWYLNSFYFLAKRVVCVHIILKWDEMF